MNEPIRYQEIPDDLVRAIERELAAHGSGFNLAIEHTGTMNRGGRWHIPVRPQIYPEEYV